MPESAVEVVPLPAIAMLFKAWSVSRVSEDRGKTYKNAFE